MTGNDIVDLRIAKIVHGLRGSRYLNKIFTPCELDLIDSSRVGVWEIWAMKEAVYKAHHRRFSLPRSFNPKQIKVHIGETSENSIIVGAEYLGCRYFGKGSLTSDYVHFTATCFPQQRLYSEISEVTTMNVKTQLKLAVSIKLGLEMKELDIVKDSNHIPHMKYRNLDLNLPFSISHHGKFTAFSYQLMNY